MTKRMLAAPMLPFVAAQVWGANVGVALTLVTLKEK